MRRLAISAEEKSSEVSLNVTISGQPEIVERIEALLAMIALNGSWGHSAIFGIDFDGDGADFVRIEGIDTDKHKPLVEALGNTGGSVEYVTEGCRGRTLIAEPNSHRDAVIE